MGMATSEAFFLSASLIPVSCLVSKASNLPWFHGNAPERTAWPA